MRSATVRSCSPTSASSAARTRSSRARGLGARGDDAIEERPGEHDAARPSSARREASRRRSGRVRGDIGAAGAAGEFRREAEIGPELGVDRSREQLLRGELVARRAELGSLRSASRALAAGSTSTIVGAGVDARPTGEPIAAASTACAVAQRALRAHAIDLVAREVGLGARQLDRRPQLRGDARASRSRGASSSA